MPLTAGDIEFQNKLLSIYIDYEDATGGTAPYTIQAQRSADVTPRVWQDVTLTEAQVNRYIDEGVLPTVRLHYRLRYTDATAAVVYSNEITHDPIVPSADPDLTVGSLTTFDAQGATEGNVEITFKLAKGQGSDGASFSGAEFVATSNESGSLSVTLLREAVYHARRGEKREWVNVKTPDSATFNLPEVLGVDQ